MADLPTMKPRDMNEGIGHVLRAHEVIREHIRERADAIARERETRDAHLNASARLEGKTG